MGRRLRRSFTYANVCATAALLLAMGGISWAAVKLPRNSVTSPTVKNSSLLGADVKNSSLTGIDVKNGALTGGDLADSSIESRDILNGTVFGGDVADDSLTGQDIRDITGADINESTLSGVPVAGFERFGPQRLTATDGVDATTARDSAPEVTLLSKGSLALTARCFRDATADTVHGEVYIRTSVAGSIVDAAGLTTLNGGSATGDFLHPATLPVDRRVHSATATNDDATWANAGNSDISALSPDSTFLRGFTYVGVRNGTVAHPQVFGEAEHGCTFGGFAATS